MKKQEKPVNVIANSYFEDTLHALCLSIALRKCLFFLIRRLSLGIPSLSLSVQPSNQLAQTLRLQ